MIKRPSSIERLKTVLYARKGVPEVGARRRALSDQPVDVKEDWEKNPEQRPTFSSLTMPKKRKISVNGLLVISALFFIVSLAVSAIFFFGGTNTVSGDNIAVTIDAPLVIPGGDELVLQIAIRNKNSVPLKLVDLLVEYPDGTRSVGDLSSELPRYRESLGTIDPGKQVQTTARAVLFGEENEQKEIKITLEYRIDGSNAIFFKEDVHTIVLSSAPIAVLVETLSEVISGQTLFLDVEVVSNATTVLKDVLLKAEYPFGFDVASAKPKASFDNQIWELGDIPPGGKQTIRIEGKLIGQDSEERVFRFASGTQSEQNERDITAAFGTATVPVTIKRPFIALDVSLNDDTSREYIARSGERIDAVVNWQNNLPEEVRDGKIIVSLAGTALDRSSITVEKGFYRSSDDTITWSTETNSDFNQIKPGANGKVRFSFAPLKGSAFAQVKNPAITFDVSVEGRRVSESNVPERIETSVSRSIKVASDFVLTPRIVRTSGGFANTGPLPPKVNQESTYTVVWTLSNTGSTVGSATVTATLPSYVRWVGAVSSNESVTFSRNTVTWNVGEVATGINAVREVAFQIGFTPSLSQVGTSPILISNQTATGFDRFAEVTVQNTRGSLTSELPSDSGVPDTHARVVE